MSTTTRGRADAVSPPSARSAATGRNLAAFAARAWKLRASGSDLVPVQGPVILASNHTAFLDGLFLVAASPRPVHVLVSADIAVAPFARALSASGQIAMASDVPDRHALGRARKVLDEAGVVGIFPEGTRGPGDCGHIDHSIAYLAAFSGALVVPVAVLGARPTDGGPDALPRLRSRIDVVFGEPADIRVEGDARRRAVLARSGERLRQLLADHVRTACARTGQTLPGLLPANPTLHRSNS